MNEQQRCIWLQSQIACALIEMEAMKAANVERESEGKALAYDEEAFMNLINRYGIHRRSLAFGRTLRIP